jgi:hypothetical protein
MKQNNGAWVPAILKGKPMAVECEIPIVFELNKPMDLPHRPNQLVIRATGVSR